MSSQTGERGFLTHNYKRIQFNFWKVCKLKPISEKTLTIYLVIENWNAKKTSKKMSKAERFGSGAKNCNWWGEVKKLENFLHQWRFLSCSTVQMPWVTLVFLMGKGKIENNSNSKRSTQVLSIFNFMNNNLK